MELITFRIAAVSDTKYIAHADGGRQIDMVIFAAPFPVRFQLRQTRIVPSLNMLIMHSASADPSGKAVPINKRIVALLFLKTGQTVSTRHSPDSSQEHLSGRLGRR